MKKKTLNQTKTVIAKSKISEWRWGIKQNYFESDPEKWWSCAICCIYSVLRRQRFSISPSDVLEVAKNWHSEKCLKTNGIPFCEIRKILLSFGVKSKVFDLKGITSFFNILKLSNQSLPLLVFPTDHVVAVLGIDHNWVYYIEPDDLKQVVTCKSHSDFFEYALLDTKLVRTLLLLPPH